MHLNVAAFEFKLGDVLLDQKLDELFNFFLIHSNVPQPADPSELPGDRDFEQELAPAHGPDLEAQGNQPL
jgi:hypothetical protein